MFAPCRLSACWRSRSFPSKRAEIICDGVGMRSNRRLPTLDATTCASCKPDLLWPCMAQARRAGPMRTLQQVLPGEARKEGVHEDVARAARQAAQPRGGQGRQQAPDQVLAWGRRCQVSLQARFLVDPLANLLTLPSRRGSALKHCPATHAFLPIPQGPEPEMRLWKEVHMFAHQRQAEGTPIRHIHQSVLQRARALGSTWSGQV